MCYPELQLPHPCKCPSLPRVCSSLWKVSLPTPGAGLADVKAFPQPSRALTCGGLPVGCGVGRLPVRGRGLRLCVADVGGLPVGPIALLPVGLLQKDTDSIHEHK